MEAIPAPVVITDLSMIQRPVPLEGGVLGGMGNPPQRDRSVLRRPPSFSGENSIPARKGESEGGNHAGVSPLERAAANERQASDIVWTPSPRQW